MFDTQRSYDGVVLQGTKVGSVLGGGDGLKIKVLPGVIVDPAVARKAGKRRLERRLSVTRLEWRTSSSFSESDGTTKVNIFVLKRCRQAGRHEAGCSG